MIRTAILSLALLLVACGGEDDHHGDDRDDDHVGGHAGAGNHDDDDDPSGGHAHEAPHGGTLVELGDHFAHIEVKLDSATGRLDLWVLDGEADRPIRLAAPAVAITLTTAGGRHEASLAAQASALTGETVGDTAHFAATVGALAGVERFEAVLGAIEVRGQRFEAVTFGYPEGNE